MNVAGYEKICRWRSTAQTWLRKSGRSLVSGADQGNPEIRWLMGYQAAELVRAALLVVDDLVPVLNEDDLEDVRERAQQVYRNLRTRDQAAKSADVRGRTQAEAAAFAALQERAL